jgi:hypothetical protein
MKRVGMVLAVLIIATSVRGEGITVQKIRGDVSVRRGVTEVWNAATIGDVLRPNDTMRTGPDGGAVLSVQLANGGAPKRITLPSQVIVDLSDIRDLTQEELMLKLAMERVRASSQEWKNDGLHLPNAAVVHGEDRTRNSAPTENDGRVGQMIVNGAKVLFDNGFYATTVLRTMEVFRMYPVLSGVYDDRLLLAQAMERANLRGEAIAEYGAMLRIEGLTAAQQQLLRERMAALREGK